MPTVVNLDDADDVRLAGYRDIRDPLRAARTNRFVAESGLVLRRLIDSGRFPLESVLLTPARLETLHPWLRRLPSRTPVYVVEAAVMKETAGFHVHRGCLALGMRGPRPRAGDALAHRPAVVVVLDDIADPDNVGGIFRSGRALGAGGLLLSDRCADPLYRKAIRTSMGAVFDVPYGFYTAIESVLPTLRGLGYVVLALTPDRAATPVGELAAQRSGGGLPTIALVVGNEGRGLSAAVLGGADVRCRVPIRSGVDSLNAHVATAVALSHLVLDDASEAMGNRSRRAGTHDGDPQTS